MAYRFERNEAVSKGPLRILSEEIESAAEGLRGGRAPGPAVHEARKSVKKSRAILRLLSPDLKEEYGGLNVALREVGRDLSHLRDSSVMLETLDELRANAGVVLKLPGIVAFRRTLAVGHKAAASAGSKAIREKAAADLTAASKNLPELKIDEDGFETIAGGLKETYRRGRRALRKVRHHAAAESFHELRKRVKDHWYHLRLLESVSGSGGKARIVGLKDLETCLGEDHNLAVFRERARQDKQLIKRASDLETLVAAAVHRQSELRETAQLLAHGLYAEKSGAFVAEMRLVWDSWKKARARRPRRAA